MSNFVKTTSQIKKFFIQERDFEWWVYMAAILSIAVRSKKNFGY